MINKKRIGHILLALTLALTSSGFLCSWKVQAGELQYLSPGGRKNHNFFTEKSLDKIGELFHADLQIRTRIGKSKNDIQEERIDNKNTAIVAILFLLIAFGFIVITRLNKRKLLRKERKFRNLFELSQDGILLRRLHADVFFDCNQAILDMLGYSDKEEFLALGPKGIVFEKQPGGEVIGDLLKKADTIIQEKKKNRFEGLFKRKDTTPLYAEVVASLVDIDGQPTIQSVIRDMTGRKKMEDNLRQLSSAVEACSASILITDSDGNIVYVNPKFVELTGYSLKEVEGLNPRFLQSGIHDKAFYKNMWNTILAGHHWHGTMYNTKKSGEKYWVRSSISCVTNDMGEITNFVGVQDDITAIKEMEEELRKAKEAADQANKAKGDFLARMSHEIRTPMNAILGMNHLALTTELNDRQRNYLEKAHSASKSLLGILGDILDFSKIEAGKLEFDVLPFNLDEVLEDLTSVVGGSAVEKDIELIYRVSPETPRIIVGDPLRLKQVLINLVNNAIKFTSAGEIEIIISPKTCEESTTELHFQVKDQGIGLSNEQIENLFQPFSQADVSTTRKYGGTGLGLAICQRLVEMMGGEIKVTSSLGEGSIFSFTAFFEIEQSGTVPRPLLPETLQGLRILIVDGNEKVRLTLMEMLEQLEVQADAVATAEEAFTLLLNDTSSFNLVLLEWHKDTADSKKIAKRIRERDKHKKVIIIPLAMQGKEPYSSAQNGLNLDSPLLKPVTLSSLAARICTSFGYEADKATSASSTEELLRAIDSIEGVKILLVEDNEMNREVATELLRAVHLEVVHAVDGIAAIDAVADDNFAIILMDIQMPRMDGYEAARKIRASHNVVPIIAMTASALSGDREKCFSAGMNDYISKPIDPPQLYRTLLRWMPNKEKNTFHRKTDETAKRQPDDQLISINHLDCTTGLMRVGGNRQLYLRLLEKFHTVQKKTPQLLIAHINNGEHDEAVRLVHTVKGVSGSIGALDLEQAAAEVEKKIIANQSKDLDASLQCFSEKLSDVLWAIGEFLSNRDDAEKIDEISSTRLQQIILQLLPAIEKRKPIKCKKILAELETYRWPMELQDQMDKFIRLVEKYQYDKAKVLARELLHTINTGVQ